MGNNLINVDYFKKVYYKSLLPLDKINDFLGLFDKNEVDHTTKILISILNTTITDTLLDDFETLEDKKQFLRLCQDNYQSPKILDRLVDEFPGSEQIIIEIIERTLLSAKKAVS